MANKITYYAGAKSHRGGVRIHTNLLDQDIIDQLEVTTPVGKIVIVVCPITGESTITIPAGIIVEQQQ